MNLSDNLQFNDEAVVELSVAVQDDLRGTSEHEIKIRQRIADSPLDKILNDLNVQDPYANLSK